MRIAELLEIEDDRVFEVVSRRLDRWRLQAPGIGLARPVGSGAPCLLGNWSVQNDTLMALGYLGAVSGYDDPDAAKVLARLVLPGVLGIRRQLVRAVEDVEMAIAAHLWICVRTIPWQRPHQVAGRIIWGVQDAVLLDAKQLSVRGPRAEGLPGVAVPDVPPSCEELGDLLAWARRAKVLSRADVTFLNGVLWAVNEVEAAGPVVRTNGACGLAGDRVSAVLAERLGVDARTVRRRTATLLGKLRACAPDYLNAVAA